MKIRIHINTCTIKFIAKNCQHPKCPLTGEQINCSIFIQWNITQEKKKKKELKHTITGWISKTCWAKEGSHRKHILYGFHLCKCSPRTRKLVYVERNLEEVCVCVLVCVEIDCSGAWETFWGDENALRPVLGGSRRDVHNLSNLTKLQDIINIYKLYLNKNSNRLEK